MLNNDSKLQDILWNVSRIDPERHLALSQNPHFYHLPTLPNANWSEFNYKATKEDWHTNHTQPIYVLTNTPGWVYTSNSVAIHGHLITCRIRTRRSFSKVSASLFVFFFYFDFFSGVCGRLESEGEGIVRAYVQHSSRCHVEHLSSEPDPGMATVRPSQSNPSNYCVSVEILSRERK